MSTQVNKTKKLVALSMLAAMSFITLLLFRIPVVLFLKYEPKDIIITISGFIYGPASALLLSIVVPFIEMITISSTGYIGFIFNVLASASFSVISSLIYVKKRNFYSAVIGLVVGSVVMIILMLAWNYFITPLYLQVSREQVAGMLTTVFLPFNILKAGINTAITLMLYKPLVTILRRVHMAEGDSSFHKKQYLLTFAFAAVVLATFILAGLVYTNRI